MTTPDAYLYYEAGQAVAAAHLGLTIRAISANPALQPSQIVLPRNDPKARMILWLTGMAAEKRGVGASSPLRRMRNRQRIRTLIDDLIEDLPGSPSRRQAQARGLLNQSQDRANAICAGLYEAIEEVVALLEESPSVDGRHVVRIVAEAKGRRRFGADGDGDGQIL